MTGYTYITLSEAEDQLAALLSDSSKVRFISDELQTYIVESLRTWNALTGMQENWVGPVAVSANTVFIDIPSVFPASCGYTLRDRDLIGVIQYHLLEPKNVSGWSGTEMFGLDDLVQALQHRRDQFLLETSCRLTRLQPADILTPLTPSYELDQSVMSVSRMAWVTSPGRVLPLWQESAFSLRSANASWSLAPGVPRTYRLRGRAPFEVEFAPPPSNTGMLDMLVVEAGADLDPVAGSGVLMGVPDDFTPIVKWGAMSDLLSRDGPSRDYARALFCERRYRMGVASALAYRPISSVKVNGSLVALDSVQSLDMALQTWQSRPGQPRIAAVAGMNLLVLSPPPKSACQLEVSLRQNAVVPALGSGGSYLQIGREYLGVILGYATHLAMFKVGGEELASTTHLSDSFFMAAADFNDRLKGMSAFEDNAFDKSDKQDGDRRRGIRRVTGSTVSEA